MRIVAAGIVKHGPFQWAKREGTADETWNLSKRVDTGLGEIDVDWPVFFSVKNYGGSPGPGFAGWKLVSGGPFDSAGAYNNLEEAVTGITPFLVDYMRKRVAEKLLEHETKMKQMNKVSNYLQQPWLEGEDHAGGSKA